MIPAPRRIETSGPAQDRIRHTEILPINELFWLIVRAAVVPPGGVAWEVVQAGLMVYVAVMDVQ